MDLVTHLRREVEFIKNSCTSYDSGKHSEAVRIATALRVLLYDGGRGKSLLTRMGTGGLRILSTVREVPPGAVLFHGMGLTRTSPSGVSVEPCLDSPTPPRLLPREVWFNQVIYLRLLRLVPCEEYERITRKDVILGAANKDGGAHVDPSFEPAYKALANGIWKRGEYQNGTLVAATPLPDAQFPFLGHMAFEILHSPDLLALTDRAL